MSKRNLAIIGATLVSLIYGVTFSVAKDVMPQYIQPFGFIVLRVLGATFLFWMVSFFSPKEKIALPDFLRITAAAFFGVAFNMLTFFISHHERRIDGNFANISAHFFCDPCQRKAPAQKSSWNCTRLVGGYHSYFVWKVVGQYATRYAGKFFGVYQRCLLCVLPDHCQKINGQIQCIYLCKMDIYHRIYHGTPFWMDRNTTNRLARNPNGYLL